MDIYNQLPLNFEADKEPIGTTHIVNGSGKTLCGGTQERFELTRSVHFCKDCRRVLRGEALEEE